MALDATVGGVSANSYITVADADAYFTGRGSPSAWTSLTTAQKEGALIYATEWLDSNYSWYSTICTTTQALGFPRNSGFDSEGRTIMGCGVIPTKIKNATCEMALQHINENLYSTEREGLKSQSFGDASETYSSSSRSFSGIKLSLAEYGSTGKTKVNILWRA
jgi:hypothetical protein